MRHWEIGLSIESIIEISQIQQNKRNTVCKGKGSLVLE